MSWSVASTGKAGAVRKEIAGQFSRGSKCLEPEETVRQSAAASIDAALAAQEPSTVVEVIANGSQSFKDFSKAVGVSNSLTISIKPIHSFIE